MDKSGVEFEGKNEKYDEAKVRGGPRSVHRTRCRGEGIALHRVKLALAVRFSAVPYD